MMFSDAAGILEQVNLLRVKMGNLWDERKETDHEVLMLSIEIDELLNEYDDMRKQMGEL